MQQWKRGIPQDEMYVMSNAWWPTWMGGPELDEPQQHEIDRIIY